MSRVAKRFFYGTFYSALIVLVAVAALAGNEGERTAPSPVAEMLRALEVRGPVTVMTAADGSAAFLVRVRNPNATHAASNFPYAFHIVRSDGTAVETSPRAGFVYPLETTVLLETAPLPTLIPTASSTRDSGAIGAEDTAVSIALGTPTWTSVEFSLRSALTLTRAETSSDSAGLFVRGEVRNAGAVTAETVRIIALAKDANGFPLFAAQTLLENVPGGVSREFFIRFPRDEGLSARAIPEGTELIVEVQ